MFILEEDEAKGHPVNVQGLQLLPSDKCQDKSNGDKLK